MEQTTSDAFSAKNVSGDDDATPSSKRTLPPHSQPTPRDLLPHIPIGHPDSMMSKESVRRAVECFQTRPTDVIVATFPKTGTTLVSWICHLLRTGGAPIETDKSSTSYFETMYQVIPWPTLCWDIGYDPNVQGSEFEPRVFKSHLRMASIYPGCRYIVTIRDPSKTTLSFYNFFLAKKVPFLVDEEGSADETTTTTTTTTSDTTTTTTKPKMDVSSFLLDMPFVKGCPETPTTRLRASIWDYYAEYHALLECPSVLILVYEDFGRDPRSQIRKLCLFLGITTDDETLIDRVASMSTKEYMAACMSKFDEPYERAKALNRAGDISQLAPGAKVALRPHQQTLDERANTFLEDRWRSEMEPLGYKDYGAFANAVRERHRRLFGE